MEPLFNQLFRLLDDGSILVKNNKIICIPDKGDTPSVFYFIPFPSFSPFLLNSAGKSPSLLVFRTKHESFPSLRSSLRQPIVIRHIPRNYHHYEILHHGNVDGEVVYCLGCSYPFCYEALYGQPPTSLHLGSVVRRLHTFLFGF